MLLKNYLPLLAFLSIVNAQMLKLGKCNPNIQTIHNFNKNRLAGKWFEIKRSENLYEVNSKCYIATFFLDEKNVYLATNSFVLRDQEEVRKLMYFTHKADDLNRGKLNFTPGLVSNEQSFWILDTDYNRYAVFYSCVNAFNSTLEFVWIGSRLPTLENVILKKAEKALIDRGINVKLIDEVQDCK